MIKKLILLPFLILPLLVSMMSGCTSKELYENLQPDRSSCRKQPVQLREQCYKQIDNNMDYDEYKKERQKL
ncbi:MAG TPA: hypothetical protein EYH16_02555 [Leucothrix mucor]|nr:hypothetical protein [Leucothrix mucor]